MPKYQGHKNWNHWNVNLWIKNEEPLYRLAQYHVRTSANRVEAARDLLNDLPAETPDGAPYTFSSVRAALAHWEA